MGFKLLASSVLISLVAFGVALTAAYCDGRWALAIGPEIFFDKCVGFSVWIALFFVLAYFFRKATPQFRVKACCLSAVLILGSYFVEADWILSSYFAGFQSGVLNAASGDQWKALPLIVKRNSMNPSENQKSMENLFPAFVWRVRPGGRFVGFPVGTNDTQISIVWRGWSFDPAIEVGPLKPSPSEYSGGIKCEKRYSNCITFMLLGSAD